MDHSFLKTLTRLLFIFLISLPVHANVSDTESFLTFIVNPDKQKLQFFLKDKKGNNYGNFTNLKESVEHEGEKLIFSTNGGMYNKKFQPIGLYIEDGVVITPANRRKKGYGNFHKGLAGVQQTVHFKDYTDIKYATQSGPMLVIDGKIHSKFSKNSKHTNIRNGVCVLPNGNILFVMSKEKVTLYHFATFFKEHKCNNALYLDGFVSKTYLPSKDWIQTEGNFGVILGVTE